MIVLTLLLVGMVLIAGLYFGRAGLDQLVAQPLRAGTLALGACAAQAVSVVTHRHRLELLILTAVMLAAFYWFNRRRAGLWLIAIGIGLNVAVMTANGGTMPINSQTLTRMSSITATSGDELTRSKDRVLDDHEAALPWLGDRLLLPGPLARLAAWSIGDVLIIAGVARFLWRTMKGSRSYGTKQWGAASPS